MHFWKVSICFTAVVVSLSTGKPLEIENEVIMDIDFLSIVPNRGKDLFPKEGLQVLINKLSRTTKAEQVTIINEYIDEFLINLNSYIVLEGLDPIPMPDKIEKFEWKVGFITYKGQISLTRGWLQGLSSLERAGDVSLTTDGQTMKINMPLTFSKIMFDYQYAAKFMGLGPRGGIDGRITDMKFTINVDVDSTSLQAELESLKLNKKGKVSIKFNGNSLTDWLANILSTVLMPVFKLLIGDILTDFVSSGVTAIIAIYNESICALVGTCLL